MSLGGEDWIDLLQQLADGDRLAFMKVNRLVTRFLTELRAYDFRDEWDDLRQEVILSLVRNHRTGKLRDQKAFLGYARSITRNKFYDRLQAAARRHEKQAVPIEHAEDSASRNSEGDGLAQEVWFAVEGLPNQQQVVLRGLYRKGMTYEQVATASGIPLGTVKRRLRQALTTLRERFRDSL